MKKRNLKLLVLVLSISFSVSLNAQFETSFEPDDGYIDHPFFGSLISNRDNGWNIFRGHTDNAVVTTDQAATGNQSIKFGIENCSTLASFNNQQIVENIPDDKTVEFKLFIPSAPAIHTNFGISARNTIGFGGPTFTIQLKEDKLLVEVVDYDNQTIEDVETEAVITRDTWMNFKVDIIYAERKVVYYLNDVQVYEQLLSPNDGFDFDTLSMVSTSDGVVFLDDLKINALTLSVAENEFSRNFTLYPNPTNGNITVVSANKETEPLDIIITNVLGQEVMTLEKQLHEGNTIDINSLNNGVYLMQISLGSKTAVKRFVKN